MNSIDTKSGNTQAASTQPFSFSYIYTKFAKAIDGIETEVGTILDDATKGSAGDNEIGIADSLKMQGLMSQMSTLNQAATSTMKVVKDTSTTNTRNVS